MPESKKHFPFLTIIQNEAVPLAVAAGISLLSCSLVLLLAGAPITETFRQLFSGAFGSWTKIAQVIKAWIPLTLCASGLIFSFRVNLWNIGIEGQVMAGAVCTTAVLRYFPDASSPALLLSLAFITAFLGGASWAILSVMMKIWGRVHEIFSGLGLNFFAQGMILWLIFGPWKRPGTASMSGTAPFPDTLTLSIHTSFNVPSSAIWMVLLTLAICALLLNMTKFGLILKAVGLNAQSASSMGIRTRLWFFFAMGSAGGLAGLTGAYQVTGVYHRLIPAISSNYGYLGLLVVLLTRQNLWLCPLVALFFAALNIGSIQLPLTMHLDSSLGGIIQGIVVLSTLTAYGWYKKRKAGSQGTP